MAHSVQDHRLNGSSSSVLTATPHLIPSGVCKFLDDIADKRFVTVP